MEGRAGVLESEIKLDMARGDDVEKKERGTCRSRAEGCSSRISTDEYFGYCEQGIGRSSESRSTD